MQDLAINGRHMAALAILTPGASSDLPDFNLPISVGASTNISFNGQRPEHNVWMIDGGENYDRGCGGCVTMMPSVDAIDEFKTLTSNASGDFGIGSGGTINMAIKSGTHDFHGAVYEFFRNDAMDANNFFANSYGYAGSRTALQHLRLEPGRARIHSEAVQHGSQEDILLLEPGMAQVCTGNADHCDGCSAGPAQRRFQRSRHAHHGAQYRRPGAERQIRRAGPDARPAVPGQQDSRVVDRSERRALFRFRRHASSECGEQHFLRVEGRAHHGARNRAALRPLFQRQSIS